MGRARRSAFSLILVVLALGGAMVTFTPRPLDPDRSAAVAWPPSSLVVSEVVTGGASASDEFIELANAGSDPVDLAGLEVVYATSTGSTVTKKASWAGPTPVGAGRHVLIANSAGSFAAAADATYSGGLAATGGAVALRVTGGAVVDAVGWGDASNAFVETTATPAPPARSSIERLPGADQGNGNDTNDNAGDWFVQASPSPQDLAWPPTSAGGSPSPAPSGSAASPTPVPSAPPQPTASPAPTATPTPTAGPASPSATSTPVSPSEPPSEAPPSSSPTQDGSPTPGPTGSPDGSSRSPDPGTPDPTGVSSPPPAPTASQTSPGSPPPPVSSPSPSASAIPIADARALPDDTTVTIEGILTTDLGALEAGRSGFVQDATGGIAIYLDAAVVDGPGAGTRVRLTGSVDDRFGQRTLRAAASAVLALGPDALPVPAMTPTGAIGEGIEGVRVAISGVVTEAPTSLADGLGLMVDDGSGPIRVVVTPVAQVADAVARGSAVVVVGPVGQHDSSGSGSSGYRVIASGAGEFSVAAPSPSPTSSPTSSPSPGPSSSAGPGTSSSSSPGASSAWSGDPSAGPSGSPAGSSASSSPNASPSPPPSTASGPIAIVEARSRPLGDPVRIRGVVTAEAGRLGSPALLVIADGTAGIVVRLPAGAVGPARGTDVEVMGTLAAPYGQLEIRPVVGAVLVLGSGVAAEPVPILSTDLGEGVEGRLVSIDVVIDKAPHRETNGGVTLDARDAITGGRLSIRADASSGIATADLPRDARATLTGVVGQRATRSGRLDGYRIWLRDRLDIVVTTPPGGSPSPTGSAGGAIRPTVSVAQALLSPGLDVRVVGTVTAAGRLLDPNGRIVVVQDATAAVAVRLPTGARTPRVGARLRVDGVMGRAYGAPRIAAAVVADLGTGAPILPLSLRTGPGAGHEWRLVRVDGVVADVHRSGDRWTAEIAIGSSRILVAGLPGAAIPSTALVEGRRATVIGIVRRPYPTASDRRFAIDPRSQGDVRIGGPASSGGTGATGGGAGGYASPGPGANDASPSDPGAPMDVDIATLGEHVGAIVHIGGIVTAVESGAILLDDGTAVGRVVLGGDASTYLDQLVPGDALDAVGRVREAKGGGTLQVDVASAAGIVRVGDPGSDAGDPGSSDPAAASAPGAVQPRAGDPTTVVDLVPEPGPSPILFVIGIIVVGGLALIAGVTLVLRRARERHATNGRIALRLAAVAGAGPDPVAPT